MTSRKAYFLLALICVFVLPDRSQAQNGFVSDEAITGEPSGSLYSAVVPLAFPRSYAYVQGNWGDRPGADGDYLSIGGFMPMQFFGPDEVFFIEGQGWITEENSDSIAGGNFGFGNRWLVRDFSQMIGINAFFSWDESVNQNQYDGGSIGAEWVSDYLGITGNFYFPWNSRDRNDVGPLMRRKEEQIFTGSNLAFVNLQLVEEQMIGGDVEIGSPIPRAEYISVFSGIYHFNADNGNEFTGYSSRVQVDLTNALVNLQYSDDERFGRSFNVSAELRLGDGPFNLIPRHRNLDTKMFDRVNRRSRIVTTTYLEERLELAINPEDGEAYEFLFVDNTAAAGGDGTFESRFNDLGDASGMPNADIILVYTGSTMEGGPFLDATGGLQLEDNQIVLGQGYGQDKGVFNLATTNFAEACPLPDFDGMGQNPFIMGDGVSDNVIELANNNQIYGLNIITGDVSQNAIGTSNTIENVFIDEINRDVDFTNPANTTGPGGGIVIDDISGIAQICNVGFRMDAGADGGVIVGNQSGADLDLVISNNLDVFGDLVIEGGMVGVDISATGPGSNVLGLVDRIIASDNGTGLRLSSDNEGTVNVGVIDSEFNDTTTGAGIEVLADNEGSSIALIQDTTATGAAGDGLFFLADNESTIGISLNNVPFDNAGAAAIQGVVLGDSTAVIDGTEVSGMDAGDDAINLFVNGDNSQLGVTLTESGPFSGAGQNGTGDGLEIFNTDGGFATVMIAGPGDGPVDFSNNQGNGLLVTNITDAVTNVNFGSGANFDDSQLGSAINLFADDNSAILVTGSEISGINAFADAITLENVGSEITLQITEAISFADAGDNGINSTNEAGGVTIVDIMSEDGNPVDFSGDGVLTLTGDGLFSSADGDDTISMFNFQDGANFNNAGDDAIDLESTDGGTNVLTGVDMTGTNVADNAIELTASGSGSGIGIDLAGTNSFNDAANNGIFSNNSLGGVIDVTIENGDFGDTGDDGDVAGDGLFSMASGIGTSSSFTLNGSSGVNLENVGDDAIDFTTTGGAANSLFGNDVSGLNAGDNAIELATMGIGSLSTIDLTGTNDFTDATNNGIFSETSAGGTVIASIDDVDFSDLLDDGDVAGDGLYSEVLGGTSSATFSFNTGASFNDVGDDAIDLDSGDVAGMVLGGQSIVFGTDISGFNAGDDAIELNAYGSNASILIDFDLLALASTDFSDAAVNGINSMNANGGTIDVTIENADFGDNPGGDDNLTMDGLFSSAAGANTSSSFNFVGGTGANFDNANDDAIDLDTTGGATNSVSGSNVSGTMAGDDAIELSTAGANSMTLIDLTGTNTFTDALNNGISSTNTTGGTVDVSIGDADFSNLAGGRVTLDGLSSAATGAGTNSTFTFNTGADFNEVGDNAIDLATTTGASTTILGDSLTGTLAGNRGINILNTGVASTTTMTVTGTNTFTDAAVNGLVSNNTGGTVDVSLGDADFSDTLGGNVTGSGLIVNTNDNTAVSTFTFNTGADFNDVSADGIVLNSVNGETYLFGMNVNATNAGDGVNLFADGLQIDAIGASSGLVSVDLTGSNDFSGAADDGLDVSNSIGEVFVSIDDADFSDAGAGGLFGNGLHSITENGGTTDFVFANGATFDMAFQDAIHLESSSGAVTTFNGDSISGFMAGDDAIDLLADGTGSDVQFNITNSTNFAQSGDNGIQFDVSDDADMTINIAGTMGAPVNFDDLDMSETGYGVIGNITDSTASLTLNHTSFDQTALGGLQINATDSTFDANITNSTFNDSNATGLEFNLDNVAGNTIVLDNVDAMDAGQQTSNGAANALTINIANGGDNEFDIDNFNGDDAYNNGFEINIDAMGAGGSSLTLDLDDSSFARAGRNAAEWNLNDSSVLESFIGGTYNNVDLSDAGQLGAAVTVADDGDALQINSIMGSRVGVDPFPAMITSNIKFNGSDLSGAAGSAMDFMLAGGSEINVAVDPTDLTGAAGNGVEFDATGGSTLRLEITDNSHISTAATPVGMHGIFGTLDDSTAEILVMDSDIANDGSTTFDAINITADNDSMLDLELINVDMSGWRDSAMTPTAGNGMVLTFNDSSGDVAVSGAGSDLSDAGVNAISITANSAFASASPSVVNLDLGTDGLSLNNAGDTGLLITADGQNTEVNVMGTDVTANNTGMLGVDAMATNGAAIDFDMDDLSASENGLGGIRLTADGIGTSDESTVTGTFNNLRTVDNGAGGDDGSFGIQIDATNGAQIGNRATGQAGLIFNNATSGNTDFMDLRQDQAALVNVDGDAFASIIFNNAAFNANEGTGVIIESNADLSATDTALARVFFNGGTINYNGGHGVHIITDEADTSDLGDVSQSGGVNASFANMDIRFNSDFYTQPLNPAIVPNPAADGNMLGYGVFIEADGNMMPDPGLANINFDMVDLSDNEEGDYMTNGGTIVNIGFNNMTLNMPIQICADSADMSQTFNNVTIAGLTGDQAAISLHASNGFTAEGIFNNVTIRDVEAQAVAILSEDTGSQVIGDFNGLIIDNAGYGTPGGTFDTKTGLLLEGVIQGSVLAGASADIDLSGVTIANVDGMTDLGAPTTIDVNAIDFEVDGAGAVLNLDISPDAPLGGLTVADTTAQAGEGEIDVEVTGGGQATINLDDINIADSDGLGVNLTEDNTVGGGISIVGLNDIQAQNAAETGFNLTGNLLDNGMLPATEVNLTNSNFSGAGGEGINIDLDVIGDTVVSVEGTMANNTDGLGVDINLDGSTNVSDLTINLEDVTANRTAPATGGGVDITTTNALGGDQTVLIDGVSAMGAQGGADGLSVVLNGLTALDTADISLIGGSNFSNATGSGVDIDVIGAAGTTTDLSVNGLTSNNSTGDGFNFRAPAMSTININDFANLTTSGNDGDGIDLSFDANTVNVGGGTFSNITSTGNDENGLTIDVTNGSTVDPILLGGTNNLSGNGSGAGFDGLDISVSGVGSTASFSLDNLTINNSGGRGIDADVYDGGTLTLNVDGGMIDMSGLQGIDINVGSMDEFGMADGAVTGGTFTGTITNIDVTNSGQNVINTADNINVFVTNGSTVDTMALVEGDGLVFDNVTANGSDQDGIDIRIEDGSTADISVNNGTTGNGNAGVGLRFNADGSTTTAELFMDDTLSQNQFNSNGAQGVLVNLTNDVTVPTLEVFAQANMNSGNGIEINAVDATGPFITINDLNLTGAQADNNGGSGLVVNLTSVNGINDFTLADAMFMDNMGDQVRLMFTNMTLTDLTIDTVTVDGQDAASQDGLEINLNNTDVTNQLLIDTLIATNNGNNGFNLVLNNSDIGDGTFGPVVDQARGGVITNSTFSSNGDNFNRGDANLSNDNFAGASILLTGASTANFDIFDNETGFTNNQGIGLNIQVQDSSRFNIDGSNFNASGQSFYNNNIVNNAGFGVLLDSREPSDFVTSPGDATGPRFNLQLGDPVEDPNTITGNGDANFAVIAANDSIGDFSIINSDLSNAVNGSDPNFAGDGLAISLNNFAVLNDFTLDGSVQGVLLNGNAGNGVNTRLSGNSEITNYLITDVAIMNNGIHGINVFREGQANYMSGIQIENSTLINNTQNGINVLHTNSPQSGPLFIDINNNNLVNNLDGVKLTGQADAIFTGSISDNTFTDQNQDGINIQLESTSALGDVTMAQGPGAFLIDGNVIATSAANGIFFDVNETAGIGASAGRAFINVLVSDSLTNETMITGSGMNGIDIADFSSYQEVQLADLDRNTYRIESIQINNSGEDGIHVNQGTQNSVNLQEFQGGIDLQIVGDNTTLDMLIFSNGDDGIDLDYESAAADVNPANGISNIVQINGVNVFNNGDTPEGPGGNGIEMVFVDTFQTGVQAQPGGAEINFDGSTQFMDNRGDGIYIDVDSNAGGLIGQQRVVQVDMVGVESTNNDGRGMFATLQNDNVGGTRTVFNIGLADPGAGAGAPFNVFSFNGAEGVIFDTQAESLSQSVFSGGTAGSRLDNNPDVYVEVNTIRTSNGTFVSSLHPYANGGGPTDGTAPGNNPGLNSVNSGQETRTHVHTVISFYNNEVEQNFADGLVLSVGSLTRMNAAVAGNMFDGNGGFDIDIFPTQSNGLNPPDSIDAGNSPPDDRIVFDPVAYLDLVLGTADTDGNGVFDGADTVLPNFGQQFRLLDAGTTATAGITTDGVYDNGSDPYKNADRPVYLMGQVRLEADNNFNTFTDWEESFRDDVTTAIINITSQFSNFVTEGNGVAFPEPMFDIDNNFDNMEFFPQFP